MAATIASHTLAPRGAHVAGSFRADGTSNDRAPANAGCKDTPWNTRSATMAGLRGLASWSSCPRKLLSLVGDYVEHDWVPLRAGTTSGDADDAVPG